VGMVVPREVQPPRGAEVLSVSLEGRCVVGPGAFRPCSGSARR
jgi:hypothetical protein